MADHKDWIPKQETGLADEFIPVWQAKLADSNLQNAYGWPADECAAARKAMAAFTDARTAYEAAPTGANRTEKDERKRDAVDAIRKFARERVRNNPKMTDAQKQELFVRVTDREPSPIAVPEFGPDSRAEADPRAPGHVGVRYAGAKPYGVDRVEIAWALSEAVIDGPDQLPNHETFPRNPWTRTFPTADRGKRMYYSLRYLGKEGESAWSDVKEVVVP